MEWADFFKLLEIVFIPVAVFLFHEVQACRKDMSDFKVHVAMTYATGTSLVRLESKIDELKDLIISEKIDGYRKRA